jgi:hypothetical protein
MAAGVKQTLSADIHGFSLHAAVRGIGLLALIHL